MLPFGKDLLHTFARAVALAGLTVAALFIGAALLYGCAGAEIPDQDPDQDLAPTLLGCPLDYPSEMPMPIDAAAEEPNDLPEYTPPAGRWTPSITIEVGSDSCDALCASTGFGACLENVCTGMDGTLHGSEGLGEEIVGGQCGTIWTVTDVRCCCEGME